MVKAALRAVFEVVTVGAYLGVVAYCGVRGHARIEGGTRCRRCFERCDGGAS